MQQCSDDGMFDQQDRDELMDSFDEAMNHLSQNPVEPTKLVTNTDVSVESLYDILFGYIPKDHEEFNQEVLNSQYHPHVDDRPV